ncbi:hypothetical protein QN277_022024 [Acacia crassicarpa]|uniref:Glycosyl transferase CAP10 domain-containing protein n=1 Tax=Acacia crassicarpa TaxID=499986 RepID=A0AAE1JI83_9FABA|nr:hypothetical protein QN277_022024 [Acacia crassicarpa]
MWSFGFSRPASFSLLFAFLFLSATFLLNWRLDLTKITSFSFLTSLTASPKVDCFDGNLSLSPPPWPSPSPSPSLSPSTSPSRPASWSQPSTTCPEYFRWIHEDLKAWKRTGITKSMLEMDKSLADFKLVIVKGRAYVKTYRRSFQTRDVFTLWGISQLLKMYPGQVPDLELLFHCGDLSKVHKKDFVGSLAPPPVFHYCGDDSTFDIVFPDWSFWGWGELKIRPWETLLMDMEEGNKKMKWEDRIPYAFWKGNPTTSGVRNKLIQCNASHQHDSYAHIYSLNWDKEIQQNYKNTKLQDQCNYRYKVYAEGRSWSVSEKYILACDSMTMFIEPKNYDFYTRGLVPLQHYWPIRPTHMCKDIKSAVEWGNSHPEKAQKLGKEGTKFLKEEVKMKYVYDYMFHVLREYASLMKFKPIIPVGAVEICSEVKDCHMEGVWKEYLNESRVESASAEPPCELPPPYQTQQLQQIFDRHDALLRQVHSEGTQTWLDACLPS